VGDRVAVVVPTPKNQQGPPLALDHHEVTGNQLIRPVPLQDQLGNSSISAPDDGNPAVEVHDRALTREQHKRLHLVCYAIQLTALNSADPRHRRRSVRFRPSGLHPGIFSDGFESGDVK
jgi:hypothetical protein